MRQLRCESQPFPRTVFPVVSEEGGEALVAALGLNRDVLM